MHLLKHIEELFITLLKLIQAMDAAEIFEHVREVDCYSNISIAYHILFTVAVASAEKNIF